MRKFLSCVVLSGSLFNPIFAETTTRHRTRPDHLSITPERIRDGKIFIEGDPIKTISFEGDFSALSTLSIEDTPLEGLTIPETFQNLKKLVVIGTKITELTIPHLTALTSLHISLNSRLINLTISARGLKKIKIDQNVGLGSLQVPGTCTDLESLSVVGNLRMTSFSMGDPETLWAHLLSLKLGELPKLTSLFLPLSIIRKSPELSRLPDATTKDPRKLARKALEWTDRHPDLMP